MNTELEELRAWQRIQLEWNRQLPLPSQGPEGVTVVAYHFWPIDKADAEFAYLECSIRETWRHCGLLPVSLVVDRTSDAVEKFVAAFSGLVSARISPNLCSGSVPSMSLDCNACLSEHFETEYALVVQNDGFPLRSGLERFLGEWDYVGAPFMRRRLLTRMLGLWPRFAVGNGGFSLRSKKICTLVNRRWANHARFLKGTKYQAEDDYYCYLLPLFSRSYRKAVTFAPLSVALEFAYDDLYQELPDKMPFGFHGAKAFSSFRKRGWIPEA